MIKLKKIPTFKTEAAEKIFWETHDSAEYIDWTKAKVARFSSLKPSTETISLRLPKGLLEDLKVMANKKDVPYQSLMKIFLAEKLKQELTT